MDTAVDAGPSQRSSAFFAELRLKRVLVPALWAVHRRSRGERRAGCSVTLTSHVIDNKSYCSLFGCCGTRARSPIAFSSLRSAAQITLDAGAGHPAHRIDALATVSRTCGEALATDTGLGASASAASKHCESRTPTSLPDCNPVDADGAQHAARPTDGWNTPGRCWPRRPR